MLRTAILFWGATSILTAPLVTALAVHVTRDLGDTAVGPGPRSWRPTGSGPSTGLAGHRAPGRPVARSSPMLIGGNVPSASSLLLVSAVTVEIPVVALVAVVAGIAQSMVLVTYITLRSAYSPDELLGRIGSTARTISLGLQPVGLLAAARSST